MNAPLRIVDPEVYQAIKAEENRQEEKIELIASENFVSSAVREAQGSVLTNKYAEGYPGRRYYGVANSLTLRSSWLSIGPRLFWRRSCQRTVTLGCSGQSSGLLRGS